MRSFVKALVVFTLVLGVSLTSCSTSESPVTTSPGSEAKGKVGTRTNPVPFGSDAKVGEWKVKVTDFVADATQAVLNANVFNHPPEAGQQYVLVTLEATYDGADSGTFWIDISYRFLGNKGNTFDSGSSFAVAPNPIIDAGEAFSGAVITGDLLFAVPSDQVAGGLLILEPSFSFDDPTFFALE